MKRTAVMLLATAFLTVNAISLENLEKAPTEAELKASIKTEKAAIKKTDDETIKVEKKISELEGKDKSKTSHTYWIVFGCIGIVALLVGGIATFLHFKGKNEEEETKPADDLEISPKRFKQLAAKSDSPSASLLQAVVTETVKDNAQYAPTKDEDQDQATEAAVVVIEARKSRERVFIPDEEREVAEPKVLRQSNDKPPMSRNSGASSQGSGQKDMTDKEKALGASSKKKEAAGTVNRIPATRPSRMKMFLDDKSEDSAPIVASPEIKKTIRRPSRMIVSKQ